LDWQNKMNHVIDYLEDNMHQDINLEEAARCAGYSLWEFQRLFSFLTNITVGVYIRRRKLSLAAHDIISTNEKIIDIALKYGYESPASFSRAFNQLFGISPSSARAERVSLELHPKLSFNKLLFEESKVNAMNDLEKYGERGYYVTFLMPSYLTKDMDKTSEWFRDVLGWFGGTIARNDKEEGTYGCIYDYPGEIFGTINPQRGFYMFHGEPSQGIVGYMHADIDNLYKFVKGNGWNKITEPSDNGYGGRGCAVTTIDGSILRFDDFDD